MYWCGVCGRVYAAVRCSVSRMLQRFCGLRNALGGAERMEAFRRGVEGIKMAQKFCENICRRKKNVVILHRN